MATSRMSKLSIRPAQEFSSTQSTLPSNTLVAHSYFIEPERRQAMIAEAAYFLAEKRSFEPGHELEDWLGAECEIDAELTSGGIRQSSPV